MILSDTSIFEALDDGRLILTPEPSPRVPSVETPTRPFDRTAVNLRLSSTLRIPEQDLSVVIDPTIGSAVRTLQRLYREQAIPVEGFKLSPAMFVLGLTEEGVTLPLPEDVSADARAKGCLAARVEGKSSLARYGLLVHFTAPTIHAGFDGHIALEIMNLGPAPILLTPSMQICQLIIEQVHGEPQAAGSQFHGQMDAAGPRSG
ncbi:MAG: dCTP deaminase [Dehalococcoidia bacterium]